MSTILQGLTTTDLTSNHQQQCTNFATNPLAGSQPKSLFDHNGQFAPDNWNSGEAVYIREWLDTAIDYGDIVKREGKLTLKDSTEPLPCVLFSMKDFLDDTTYATFLVVAEGHTMKLFDQYAISIYKNRGGVEQFTKNGHPITRADYIQLLTILQACGFNIKNNN